MKTSLYPHSRLNPALLLPKEEEEENVRKKKMMKGGEGMAAKRAAIGRTLVDVTNLGNPNTVDPTDSIHRHIKENSMLRKLLDERTKLVELIGNELGKLRTTVQKLQLQNRSLAQSNGQMLAELNSGKDKLKALRHELFCKEAVLKVKNVQVKTQADTSCQVGKSQEVEKLPSNCSRKEESSTKRSDARCMRSSRRTMGRSTANQHGELKKVESKRRRQSARFIPHKQEAPEDLFEIEDVILPVTKSSDDPLQEDDAFLSGSSAANEASEQTEMPRFNRSSLGRPMRKATEKVESYKEISLRVKMRRQ